MTKEVVYGQTHSGIQNHLSSKTELLLLTISSGHCKREEMSSLFQFRSSFSVVKCCGKLDGLAKQRWMFSPKQSADGAHSRGKLCKSLH